MDQYRENINQILSLGIAKLNSKQYQDSLKYLRVALDFSKAIADKKYISEIEET